jgi:mRNA-degrading endonuclease YafQ of YafQ-DinJ toxin-antitoxin module
MKKLEKELIDEVFEKIDLFKDVKNHKLLKVHKLHGKFSKYFSFSVNYKTRIVFEYETKNEVVFLAIGDHDLYK